MTDDDWLPDHQYEIRQAKDAPGRAWEAVCRCGWISHYYFAILTARRLGENHCRLMSQAND